ncbi:MAG: hypothetical protein C0483_14035 [Pirellula sp.]|nr:hypothetical protein [Pirellula sp.]
MQEHRFPSPMPQPTDDAYPVEPPVSHVSDLQQSGPVPETVDEYAVGEELARAPYCVDANSWQEIVAATDADEPYAVAPQIGQPPTRGARLLARHAERLTQEQRAADQVIGRLSDPQRFTLRRLLFIFTLASVVFAVGAQMPRAVFAGTAGGAALAMALVSRWLVGESAPAKLAWWTLMAIYLLASIFAALSL